MKLMKICKTLIYVGFFMFVIAGTVYGEDYSLYIAPGGNDNAGGTIEDPLATPEGAYKKIQTLGGNNTTVYIRGGKYRMANTIHVSNSYNITFCAYEGEEVLLSGASEIQNSSVIALPNETNIQEAIKNKVTAINASQFTDMCDISDLDNMSEFIYNDMPMNYAKYPDNKYMYTDNIYSNGELNVSGAKISCSDSILQNIANEKNVYMGGNLVDEWYWNLNKVKSTNAETGIIETDLPFESNNSIVVKKDMPYYLTNSAAFITKPGDYYIDKDKKIIYFYPDSPVSQSNMELITLKGAMFDIGNSKNIIFRNITFDGGKSCAVVSNACESIVIDKCIVKNFLKSGADFWSSKNCSVTNSKIYDLGGKGINVQGGNIELMELSGFTLKNCEIARTGRINKNQAVAIWTHGYDGGTGAYIGHNVFHDMPFQAVGLNFESIVEYNEIYNVCTACGDMGAIYAGGTFITCRGGKIRNNYIHDIPCNFEKSKCGTNGIYLDMMACGVEVYNNVVANVNRNFYYSSEGGYNKVYNNVFIGNEKAKMLLLFPTSAQSIRVAGYGAAKTTDEVKNTIPEYCYTDKLWTEKYPQIKEALDSGKPVLPTHMIYNNILYRCNDFSIDNAAYDGNFTSISNNWQKRENPGFIDVKMNKFQLKPDARVFCQLPGFKKIDMSDIGITE